MALYLYANTKLFLYSCFPSTYNKKEETTKLNSFFFQLNPRQDFIIKRTNENIPEKTLLKYKKKWLFNDIWVCARPSFKKNMIFHMAMGVGRRKLQCTHHLNTNCWFNNLLLNDIILSNMVYLTENENLF